MFEKLLVDVKAGNVQALSTLCLLIISDAATYGECPWCESPIGDYPSHYRSDCPFKALATIIAELNRR